MFNEVQSEDNTNSADLNISTFIIPNQQENNITGPIIREYNKLYTKGNENIFFVQFGIDLNLQFNEITSIAEYTTSQIESSFNDINQMEDTTYLIEALQTETNINITISEAEINNRISELRINNHNLESEINIKISETEIFIKTSVDQINISSSEPKIYTSTLEGHQNILDFEYFDNLNYTFEEINQKIYENILNNVIQNIEISNEDGHVIKGKDNFFYHITTSENELNNANKKNNDTNRLSRIDLGECENKLRDHYKLNKNISLLILKYEKVANISSERQLQYEIYESLNKTKLNLSVCSDVQVDIYVPVILSEEKQNLYNELQDLGYDLFDIENVFYQDICTPYKSENNTDILLSDRIDYIYNNQDSQCQNNCQFSSYLLNSSYINCTCNVA